jgi:hypothetical protein
MNNSLLLGLPCGTDDTDNQQMQSPRTDSANVYLASSSEATSGLPPSVVPKTDFEQMTPNETNLPTSSYTGSDHATNIHSQPGRSEATLLDLPLELRYMIYDYLLTSTNIVDLYSSKETTYCRRFKAGRVPQSEHKHLVSLGLLRTCRKSTKENRVRHEHIPYVT